MGTCVLFSQAKSSVINVLESGMTSETEGFYTQPPRLRNDIAADSVIYRIRQIPDSYSLGPGKSSLFAEPDT